MTVAPVPATPGKTSFWKKLGASFLAAFSTPEAIKAEKYLAVVGLTRAAVLVPGAGVLIYALVHVLGG